MSKFSLNIIYRNQIYYIIIIKCLIEYIVSVINFKSFFSSALYVSCVLSHIVPNNTPQADRTLYRCYMYHCVHSADGNYEVTLMTKATVYYTGLVVWQPPAVYKSSCAIDVEYFPYDVQTCVLKLGSWTYDGFKVPNITVCYVELGCPF